MAVLHFQTQADLRTLSTTTLTHLPWVYSSTTNQQPAPPPPLVWRTPLADTAAGAEPASRAADISLLLPHTLHTRHHQSFLTCLVRAGRHLYTATALPTATLTDHLHWAGGRQHTHPHSPCMASQVNHLLPAATRAPTYTAGIAAWPGAALDAWNASLPNHFKLPPIRTTAHGRGQTGHGTYLHCGQVALRTPYFRCTCGPTHIAGQAPHFLLVPWAWDKPFLLSPCTCPSPPPTFLYQT